MPIGCSPACCVATPMARRASSIRAVFRSAFSPAHVSAELAYLARPYTEGFERPYGWAWLLMLAAELAQHDDDEGRRWSIALAPLTDAFAQRFVAYLPKATYPTRTGVHSNTAFALALAWDYAVVCRHQDLAETVMRPPGDGTWAIATARRGSRVARTFCRPALWRRSACAGCWRRRNSSDGSTASSRVWSDRSPRPYSNLPPSATAPMAGLPISMVSISAVPGAGATWRLLCLHRINGGHDGPCSDRHLEAEPAPYCGSLRGRTLACNLRDPGLGSPGRRFARYGSPAQRRSLISRRHHPVATSAPMRASDEVHQTADAPRCTQSANISSH